MNLLHLRIFEVTQHLYSFK